MISEFGRARAAADLAPLAGRGRERSERVRRAHKRPRCVESPPHPTAFAALRRSTSPRQRGEGTELASRLAFPLYFALPRPPHVPAVLSNAAPEQRPEPPG